MRVPLRAARVPVGGERATGGAEAPAVPAMAVGKRVPSLRPLPPLPPQLAIKGYL